MTKAMLDFIRGMNAVIIRNEDDWSMFVQAFINNLPKSAYPPEGTTYKRELELAKYNQHLTKGWDGKTLYAELTPGHDEIGVYYKCGKSVEDWYGVDELLYPIDLID